MLQSTISRVRAIVLSRQIPPCAKHEHTADRAGLSANDPGITHSVEEAIGWLCRAQDNSASNDGGVARHFSLVDGWAPSYPETTGYIIPTVLAYSRAVG